MIKEAKGPSSSGIVEKLRRLHFQKIFFQQDDASVYKANIVIKFLKEEEREVLEWWANSPNLNPIENLWPIVKQELRKPREIQERFEEK